MSGNIEIMVEQFQWRWLFSGSVRKLVEDERRTKRCSLRIYQELAELVRASHHVINPVPAGVLGAATVVFCTIKSPHQHLSAAFVGSLRPFQRSQIAAICRRNGDPLCN